MSAIAGILNLDGQPADPLVLGGMLERMEHRGSDARGEWIRGPVALGFRALWTTPESIIEELPLRLPGGQGMLAGDIRLDNRDELRSALGLTRATPDGAIVAAAYDRWGEPSVAKLRGDFAFALWDERRRMLICARDHMGVKPFYYAAVGRRFFVFATEIKAILGVPGVLATINEQKVVDEFVHAINDPAATYYTQIHRLPPAHTVTAASPPIVRRYWRLDPTRELKLGSDAEYAEGFRTHFVRAVECRLRSRYPVGSMLSGGMDSSSVACVARDLLRKNGQPPLHTYSAVFDEVRQCDERPFIQAALQPGHCNPEFIVLDGLSPMLDADEIMWHLDEPLSASNLYLSWSAYRRAQQRGVRVMLDGFDGDTTVSHGSGRLRELAHAQRWWDLAVELRGGARHFRGNFWLDSWWRWIWKHHPLAQRTQGLWRKVRRPWPAVPARAGKFTAAPAGQDPMEVINPQLAARLELQDRLRQSRSTPRDERERHWQILEREIMSRCAELFAHTSGAFGMEVRLPFMDVPLIEYCLSLPSDQKMRGGYTRYVMRGGMEGILPETIRWRGGKSDLGPSFAHGLRKFEARRLEEILRDHTEVLAPYLHLGRLADSLGRFRANTASDQDVSHLWKAASLARWLKPARPVPDDLLHQERR